MVKARRPAKPTTVKASSTQLTRSVPPVEKWNKVQSKKAKKSSTVPESFPGCIECGEAVDADVKALQCEMCSEEVWKCAQCLGLNDEMYEFLASSTDHGLHWFCDKCEEIIVDGIGSLSNKLLSSLHKLVEKSDLIEQKLCDVTANVDQKINDTAIKLEQLIDDKVKAVETGVAHLITQQQSSSEMQTCSAETQIKQSLVDVGMVQECVVKALDVKNQEDKEEEMEIKKRATSVIVHGVAESDATDTSQRETEDIDVIAAMMHEMDSDDVKATKIVRLGKKPMVTTNINDNTPKPRPIKLVLESEEQKIQVLKRAKNLRLAKEGGWETVFIHQDLTPKQREARKQLLQEMRERVAKGEGDLMIFNGKIVKRRPRPGSS